MSDIKSPTQGQVIRRALEFFSAGLFVCRPGLIQSIDPTSLLCSVKPLLKEFTEDSTGATIVEPLAIVPGCVLYFPEGDGFVDTFPVKKGDACWLIFTDRALDQWQVTGTDTDPVWVDRHNLSGALVIVGGRAKAKVIQEFDPARRVIGKQGGPRAAFSATQIHLGVAHQQDATESVMLGDKYTGDESTTFQNIATKLTTAQVALTAAQGTLTSAAASNAVPLYGGAVAAGQFVAAAAALGQAATALGQAAIEFITFATAQASRLSQKVKVV